jgi:hypothetical protein
VNEHILAAVVTNDEAEAFLRIEEFDDAFAFANDLGRHSATSAAAAEATASATTAAEATASAAAEAATAATVSTAAAAAKAAAVTKATTVAEATASTGACESPAIITTEIVALVTSAPTAVTLTPSIETHGNQTLLCPEIIKPTRWAIGATGRTHRIDLHARSGLYMKNGATPRDSMVKGWQAPPC